MALTAVIAGACFSVRAADEPNITATDLRGGFLKPDLFAGMAFSAMR